jgi:hypothetical protein
MKMKHKMTRYARKVKGKLTTISDPEPLEALARQSQFIQRSSSKLSGKDFVELMTTELMQEPAVSLEGLCDRLVDLNPQAEMTPQALHQRINPYAVTYLQEVFQLALRQHSSSPSASDSQSARWLRLVGCCLKTARNAAYMKSWPRRLKALAGVPAPRRSKSI